MPLNKKTTRTWIHGITGRMGQALVKSIKNHPSEFQLLGGSGKNFISETFSVGRPVSTESLAHVLEADQPNLIFDFSSLEGNQILLESLNLAKCPKICVLIGTTGFAHDTKIIDQWRTFAEKTSASVLVAPNTSVGILLTLNAALHIAKPLRSLGFDIELVETHHHAKKDAPSGTALFLANTLAENQHLKVVTDRQGARQPDELGVHSVRGGGVVGDHEIRFISNDQEITISHRAFSRSLFADGALVLSRWLAEKGSGLHQLQEVDL